MSDECDTSTDGAVCLELFFVTNDNGKKRETLFTTRVVYCLFPFSRLEHRDRDRLGIGMGMFVNRCRWN
jgi:hypothetical protein